METSAGPTGSSRTEMALQSCPKSRQRDQAFAVPHEPGIACVLPPGRGITMGNEVPLSTGQGWRKPQPWAISSQHSAAGELSAPLTVANTASDCSPGMSRFMEEGKSKDVRSDELDRNLSCPCTCWSVSIWIIGLFLGHLWSLLLYSVGKYIVMTTLYQALLGAGDIAGNKIESPVTRSIHPSREVWRARSEIRAWSDLRELLSYPDALQPKEETVNTVRTNHRKQLNLKPL